MNRAAIRPCHGHFDARETCQIARAPHIDLRNLISTLHWTNEKWNLRLFVWQMKSQLGLFDTLNNLHRF